MLWIIVKAPYKVNEDYWKIEKLNELNKSEDSESVFVKAEDESVNFSLSMRRLKRK